MRLYLTFQAYVGATMLLASAACANGTVPAGGPNAGTSPTPPPVGAISANPTSLTFTATGSSAAVDFGTTQNGFTGTFAESDTCSGIATVTSANAAGPSATFAVTPTGGGSCTITITGGSGSKATVGVGVTTSSLRVNGVEGGSK